MGCPTYRNGGTPHSNNMCPRKHKQRAEEDYPRRRIPPGPTAPTIMIHVRYIISVGFWDMRRNGSAMDIGLQRAAKLNLDIFFLGEAHLGMGNSK